MFFLKDYLEFGDGLHPVDLLGSRRLTFFVINHGRQSF